MKDDLLRLIDRVDSLEDLIGNSEIIYNIPEFANWKQQLQFELESICADKNNRAIESALDIIKNKFMGYDDRQRFSNLKGALLAIRNNINLYYPPDFSNSSKNKPPKVFISHSSKDKDYVTCIVSLLEYIGLRDKTQLFCSSISGYNIPLGENVYDYLKQQFELYNLHVIFILSKNYYDSPACLNEMGATWVLKNKYTSILLPSFEFQQIKGAIDPTRIGIKLDSPQYEIQQRLSELKESLLQEFNLSVINNNRWECKRNEFISEILKISKGGDDTQS